MGLDMYLYRRTYVQNWEHHPPSRRYDITVAKGGKPTAIDPKRINYIIEEVCNWRKANAIHNWFVKNVQGDIDDCREATLEREQLAELLGLIGKVLESKNAEDLPPTEGFFFGSTEVDEYYFTELERTQKVLTAVLAEESDGDFYYHSSW